MRGAGWLLLAASCGRVEFDRLATTADAMSVSDGAADTATDADVFDPSACPASYTITIPSTNTRYRYASDFLDWPGAESDCVSDLSSPLAFTHLAVFTTLQEEAEITAMFLDFWVGYSDRRTEGAHLAVTAEPLGTFLDPGSAAWFPGEPNNQGPGENCEHVKQEDALNDADCGISKDHLCECDGYPDDPSRY